MSDRRIYAKQVFDRPLDEVFAFFADAQNLAEVTPEWLRFEILTPTLEMRVGATIDYKLHLGPIPLRWTSEITAYEPGVRFVDEQRRGPYRTWVHEHRFASLGDHTIVEDFVDYSNPGGRWADLCFVRPQLRRIFSFRQKVMGEKFGRVEPDVLEIGRVRPESSSRTVLT